LPISSRSKVVAAAVDEFVDINVVDDIVCIVVSRQVGQHQLILVEVVHHCATQNNATNKQSPTAAAATITTTISNFGITSQFLQELRTDKVGLFTDWMSFHSQSTKQLTNLLQNCRCHVKPNVLYSTVTIINSD